MGFKSSSEVRPSRFAFPFRSKISPSAFSFVEDGCPLSMSLFGDNERKLKIPFGHSFTSVRWWKYFIKLLSMLLKEAEMTREINSSTEKCSDWGRRKDNILDVLSSKKMWVPSQLSLSDDSKQSIKYLRGTSELLNPKTPQRTIYYLKRFRWILNHLENPEKSLNSARNFPRSFTKWLRDEDV